MLGMLAVFRVLKALMGQAQTRLQILGQTLAGISSPSSVPSPEAPQATYLEVNLTKEHLLVIVLEWEEWEWLEILAQTFLTKGISYLVYSFMVHLFPPLEIRVDQQSHGLVRCQVGTRRLYMLEDTRSPRYLAALEVLCSAEPL